LLISKKEKAKRKGLCLTLIANAFPHTHRLRQPIHRDILTYVDRRKENLKHENMPYIFKSIIVFLPTRKFFQNISIHRKVSSGTLKSASGVRRAQYCIVQHTHAQKSIATYVSNISNGAKKSVIDRSVCPSIQETAGLRAARQRPASPRARQAHRRSSRATRRSEARTRAR